MQPAPHTADFIRLMANPRRFRLYLLTHLPSAFFAGLRIRGMDQTQSKFDKVVLLSFDAKDHFMRRIDAANAVLRDQGWILQDVQIIEPNKPPQHLPKMTVPAKLR